MVRVRQSAIHATNKVIILTDTVNETFQKNRIFILQTMVKFAIGSAQCQKNKQIN